MTTTYCGKTERQGPARKAVCGQSSGTDVHQCTACEQRDVNDALMRKAALSIARVAHEVCSALAVSNGDYSTKPWEALPQGDQDRLQARVMGFLNNPEMHPTSDLGPAVATLSASARSSAYVFHGVVHAIAREQARD
ncbi:MAG: hypothetical protein EOO27_43690 [Comamonadaceae bacterium]|nr:MAG: hypothetical protein EOO27_43690 [Comamonadaceae bacterium]